MVKKYTNEYKLRRIVPKANITSNTFINPMLSYEIKPSKRFELPLSVLAPFTTLCTTNAEIAKGTILEANIIRGSEYIPTVDKPYKIDMYILATKGTLNIGVNIFVTNSGFHTEKDATKRSISNLT